MFRALSLRVLVALALAFTTVAAFAADEDAPKSADAPKAKAKAKSKAKNQDGLQGYYSIVAKELKLTEEQKKRLQASLAERNSELKTWDDANGAKLAELAAAEAKAKEAGDAAGGKKAGDEARALKKGRTAIEDSSRGRLQAILNDEQKSHLQGYNLYVGAMTRFSKAELTVEQKQSVKTLALAAGKGLSPDLKGKELTKVKNDLAAQVEKEVLTQAQRDAMAKAAEKAKPKAKAPTTAEKSGE